MEQGPSFTDITVVTDNWTDRHDDELPAGEPGVELAPGLSLERLPGDQVDRCVDACRERGLNFDGGKSQFSQLYSFVRRYPRDEPPDGSEFGFDPDGLIEAAIRMSRLIVLNSHSNEWSVRRLSNVFPMGEQPQLVPLRCNRRFFGYRVASDERDWLVQRDADALGRLLRRFIEVRDRLPDRVTHCHWMIEWGARIPFFQPALVNTVTTLEALLNTGPGRQRAQFVTRTCALANEVRVVGISESEADAMFTARSQSVHGEFVPVENDSPESARLAAFQLLAATTLRRAIEDGEFVEHFRTTEAVKEHWPVD